MKRLHLVLPATLLFLGAGSAAASPERLVELVNAYRAAPPSCEGKKSQPLAPLAPDARLSQLQMDGHDTLQQAMRESDYRASRVEAISVSGPPNAKEAFDFAAKQHCRMLQSPHYTAIGVSQQGEEWRIVLAQPLLSSDLGDWRRAGQQVLEQVNAARGKERRCGDKTYPPVQDLQWNGKLAKAALAHSRDMMQHDYLAHEGRDGSTVEARVQAQGYRWRQVGENIATGQGSAERVVRAWLSSPGHCANIMNGSFTEMGAAYVYQPDSKGGIYWTQVFARPR